MCGVVGLINPRQKYWKSSINAAATDVFKGLLSIQHRGQDGAGMASFDFSTERFCSHKSEGLVTQAISSDQLSNLYGEMALGHVRYPTAGGHQNSDLQPQLSGFPIGVAMAHNGNIVNHKQIAQNLKSSHQVQYLSENDLESFLLQWAIQWSQGQSEKQDLISNLTSCGKSIFENFVGGYALVGLLASQGLFAMRDPNGVRPLILGRKFLGLAEDGRKHYSFCLASESTALALLEYDAIRDILPGEFIFISPENCEGDENIFSFVVENKRKKSFCMFEWVYFSAAESSLEERSVYETRLRLGEKLGEEVVKDWPSYRNEIDVVCPVPDTSRTSAIAIAEHLGLPYREALIKNRYIQRSFILADQSQREKAISMKLSPVVSEIKGKRIFLIDDSLVRGSTSKKIIKLLKDKGAKEVYLGLTCPPLKHPCFYGIDFPDPKELAASNRDLEQTANWIGASKIFFISEKGLVDAIGLGDKLCLACVSGQYPTSTESFSDFSRYRSESRDAYKKN